VKDICTHHRRYDIDHTGYFCLNSKRLYMPITNG